MPQRPNATDRLLWVAYENRHLTGVVRGAHDPVTDPGGYVRALLAALRDGRGRPAEGREPPAHSGGRPSGGASSGG